MNFDVDNSSKTPWVPRLDQNPHGKVPQVVQSENGIPIYRHPYSEELDSLEYLPEQVSYGRELLYCPMSETEHVWIDEPSQISALVEELSTETVIAVDLEHHSLRSFLGFTCLLQIGTRTQDFLIDTIELRDHLQSLNQVFANPRIVKVLHGAKMDIMWLQRDLGLYIVNLFDTHEAACALDFSRRRLVDLLSFYCQQKIDKTYQLADWSLRPLPPGMLDYARSDVHYLLYVYDRLRNTLVENGEAKIRNVLQKSKELCARTYRKPLFCAERFLKRTPALSETQRRTFTLLCRFRDEMARKLDESVGYLEPLKNLIQLCTHCGSLEDFQSHIPRESRVFSKHVKIIFRMISTFQSSGVANVESTVEAIFASSEEVEVMEVEESAGTTGPGLFKGIEIQLPKIEVISSNTSSSTFIEPFKSSHSYYKHSSRVPEILQSIAAKFEKNLSGLVQKKVEGTWRFNPPKPAPARNHRPNEPRTLRKRPRDGQEPVRKKQRMEAPEASKTSFNYGQVKFGEKKQEKRKDNFRF